MSIEVPPSVRVAGRLLVAAVLLVFSLPGCDVVDYVVGKRKEPLPGDASRCLPNARGPSPVGTWPMSRSFAGPTVNDSWPQSGGFANYTMHNLAVSDFAPDHLDRRCRAGSSTSRILTTPPIVAEGKVFAKDAQAPCRRSTPTPASSSGESP